ncbi:MAG: nucleotidyltransferase domain-containing protein [Bacteroidota bacterium]
METLIPDIVSEVKKVRGVRAIVLGGSRARGTHTPSSDIDLGIYYDPARPLDVAALGEVATQLDDRHAADLVTPIGGWGPWINGGGWLRISNQPVDFLYRDLEKVQTAITGCLNGNVEIHYQPGHPFGFLSSIYVSEVAVCRPLWDPEGVLAKLKPIVHPYPDPLKKAILSRFAWEINFSIDIAKKSVERADVAYASGCCFRSVMCMLQALFALNREYWLNEKGALNIAESFEIKPADLRNRVNEVFRNLEAESGSLQTAIALLMELSLELEPLIQES